MQINLLAEGYPLNDDSLIEVDSIDEIRVGKISSPVLRAVLELCPVAVYFKDYPGNYINLNRNAARTLGWPDIDPIGKRDSELTADPVQYRSFRDKELECMRERRIIRTEVRWHDVHGAYHVNEVINVPVINRCGESIGLIAITHSITHQASLKMANNLMSILRHDWVNTLLTGLVNRLSNDNGRKVPPPEQLKRVFEFMQGYLDNLASLLREYDSSREGSFKTVNLYKEVFEYMAEFAQTIELKIQLDFTSVPKELTVRGDAVCLRIMCLELMQNHGKHGQANKLIVRTAPDSDPRYVRLEFVSIGKLYEPHEYSELYQYGKRLQHYDEEGYPIPTPGIGAGLNFCRSLVLVHNGCVESGHHVYRNKIYGAYPDDTIGASVFWFRFPIIRCES